MKNLVEVDLKNPDSLLEILVSFSKASLVKHKTEDTMNWELAYNLHILMCSFHMNHRYHILIAHMWWQYVELLQRNKDTEYNATNCTNTGNW